MLVVQYMESLGNDFVVIDGVTQFFEPSSKEISKVLNFDHDFSWLRPFDAKITPNETELRDRQFETGPEAKFRQFRA